ncbi:unnamed protein product [Adineta steineri]|uniref:Cytidyltransferase-like domain-containing protein n=1 Tax=Adineta steineri TaxID=433720 RepID=A0A818K4K5_9BILA|nr:unnamed protein product [Adineta steineri]CAF3553633.1 unnamed protein product [Adineta steineri]
MHSELTTDLSIILSNLNNVKSNGKENVVLLKTGSLNPIHRSHISNMIQTKKYLEEICNFNVIGGYLSPTHDHYVGNKLGDELLHGQLRIEMCQNAIQEENQQHWLTVDKAECLASNFINLNKVASSLQMFLNEKIRLDKPIKVIYVAGLDLFNRCKGMNGLRQGTMGGVAVVYRYGQDKSLIQSFIKENTRKLYFIALDEDNIQNDISSTLIRQKLKSNENCSHLTYNSVLQFLQFDSRI